MVVSLSSFAETGSKISNFGDILGSLSLDKALTAPHGVRMRFSSIECGLPGDISPDAPQGSGARLVMQNMNATYSG